MNCRKPHGFTLLELLVVLAIVAIGSAGVGLAMRDGTQNQLEREAQRLAALLESARAQSQLMGVPVRWYTTGAAFRFAGLNLAPGSTLEVPQTWLDADTRASVDVPATAQTHGQPGAVLLGPEPFIAPQSVTLTSHRQPGKRVRLATDGVRPFAVQPVP